MARILTLPVEVRLQIYQDLIIYDRPTKTILGVAIFWPPGPTGSTVAFLVLINRLIKRQWEFSMV